MGPAAVGLHKETFGWLRILPKGVAATELQDHKMDKGAMTYSPTGAPLNFALREAGVALGPVSIS